MHLRTARAAAAIAMALEVGACFSSRVPLIEPENSVSPFGESGAGRRVALSRSGKAATEPIFYRWVDRSYVLFAADGRREPLAYRLAPLEGEWYIAQRIERGVADYGLARREGARLWVYAPQCIDLPQVERDALALRLSANGECLVTSYAQLRAAMGVMQKKPIKPEGYYELAAAN